MYFEVIHRITWLNDELHHYEILSLLGNNKILQLFFITKTIYFIYKYPILLRKFIFITLKIKFEIHFFFVFTK